MLGIEQLLGLSIVRASCMVSGKALWVLASQVPNASLLAALLKLLDVDAVALLKLLNVDVVS